MQVRMIMVKASFASYRTEDLKKRNPLMSVSADGIEIVEPVSKGQSCDTLK